MTEEKARHIGRILALESIGIGLLIAQLIMTYLSSDSGFIKGFFWFTTFSYKLNILIGICIMILCGLYFGSKAGKEILIKKREATWIGIKYGFLILFATAFMSSWTGFFQEGISRLNTDEQPFLDYILKPTFWIMTFGIIPVLIVGLWFGNRVKKRQDIATT